MGPAKFLHIPLYANNFIVSKNAGIYPPFNLLKWKCKLLFSSNLSMNFIVYSNPAWLPSNGVHTKGRAFTRLNKTHMTCLRHSKKNLKPIKKRGNFLLLKHHGISARTCMHWVMSAKQEVTSEKRLETLISDSANERTIPQLTRTLKKRGY